MGFQPGIPNFLQGKAFRSWKGQECGHWVSFLGIPAYLGERDEDVCSSRGHWPGKAQTSSRGNQSTLWACKRTADTLLKIPIGRTENALMFEKASRRNLLNGWWRWWDTLTLLTVCTHNVVNSYRTMKSFQEHEGTLEHTTFTPPCSHLPLDAHWNEWSVEYETISNLISVLEALKDFCHWMCRGDPYCPSAANTPPGSEGVVVSRNTPTSQHEKARVWGWGQATWQWDWGRSLWILSTAQEKIPVRATLSDELSQLLFLTWHGGLANKRR